MRFNWDAVIPAVALMHEDEAIKPISGTGFEVERGKNPGEYTINLSILAQPTDKAEPQAPQAT